MYIEKALNLFTCALERVLNQITSPSNIQCLLTYRSKVMSSDQKAIPDEGHSISLFAKLELNILQPHYMQIMRCKIYCLTNDK